MRSISPLFVRAPYVKILRAATIIFVTVCGSGFAAPDSSLAQQAALLTTEVKQVKGVSDQYMQDFVGYCKTVVAKPGATVSLHPTFPSTTIKRTPLREIGRIVRGDGDVSHTVTPGVTQPRQTVTPSLEYSYFEDPKTGLVCSTLQAHYEIGYGDIFVHLASELKEGSGGYNAVLEHEQGHVKIYRDDLDSMRERVIAAAQGAITNEYVVSGSLDEAIAKHVARAKELVRTHVMPAMAEVNVAQAQHDNPDELASVNAQLIESGELRKPLLRMLAEMERSRVATR